MRWLLYVTLCSLPVTLCATEPDRNTDPQATKPLREWTDASGSKTARARLLRVEGEKVWLQKENGKIATTDLSKLSVKDRRFVADSQADGARDVAQQTPDSSAGGSRLLGNLVERVTTAGADLLQSGPKIAAIPKSLDVTGMLPSKPALVPATVIHVRISEQFLEDYVERNVHERGPVRDTILGTRVVGHADTRGHTRLELRPSKNNVVADVHFSGTTTARTRGFNGPITLHSVSETQFRVSKRVTTGSSSKLVSKPTETWAKTTLRTVGVSSSLPRLLGRISERIAWRRAAESRRQAEAITARKAANRISHELDAQVNLAVAAVQAAVRAQVPRIVLDDKNTKPVVNFHTTSDYVDMVMVRPGAKAEELKLLPPSIAGSPDIAVRIHRTVLSGAVLDPQIREKVAPLLTALLRARVSQRIRNVLGNSDESLAYDLKWSVDRNWLALEFVDPRRRQPKPLAVLTESVE